MDPLLCEGMLDDNRLVRLEDYKRGKPGKPLNSYRGTLLSRSHGQRDQYRQCGSDLR